MGSPRRADSPALEAVELCVRARPGCSGPRPTRSILHRLGSPCSPPPNRPALQRSSHNTAPPLALRHRLPVRAHRARPSQAQLRHHSFPRTHAGPGQVCVLPGLGTPVLPAEQRVGKRLCAKPAHSPRGLAGLGGLHCLSVQAPPAKQQHVGGAPRGDAPRAGQPPAPSPRLAPHSPLDQEALGPRGSHVALGGHLFQEGRWGLGHPEIRAIGEFPSDAQDQGGQGAGRGLVFRIDLAITPLGWGAGVLEGPQPLICVTRRSIPVYSALDTSFSFAPWGQQATHSLGVAPAPSMELEERTDSEPQQVGE